MTADGQTVWDGGKPGVSKPSEGKAMDFESLCGDQSMGVETWGGGGGSRRLELVMSSVFPWV
jgi:hypothetical protein